MALEYTVKVEGLDQLVAGLAKAGGNAAALLHAAVINSATHIQSEARQRAPHRTGTLQRSILVEKGELIATVKVNEKYGIYLEEGTEPYDIVPRNKKALWWPGAAYPVRKVHHPGLKARPFFKPALDASMPYVQAQFNQVAKLIIKAITQGRV